MRTVAIDTETFRFRPGRMAPQVVCVSYYEDGLGGLLRATDPDIAGWLRGAARGELRLVGHNIAYDMACLASTCPALLPSIFDAYAVGGIVDTGIRELFERLEAGTLGEDDASFEEGLSLSALSSVYLGRKLEKGEDTWRLRYAELSNTPFHDWPAAAVEYAENDARTTFELWCVRYTERYPDLPRQCAYAFALHLMSCWGLRTDADAVAELRAIWEAKQKQAETHLRAHGLLRANGTKDMKVIQSSFEQAWRRSGLYAEQADKTPTGAWKTDRLAVSKLAHVSPILSALNDYKHAEKVLGTYVPMFEDGTVVPLHPKVSVLKATGRISQSKPSLQQLPREAGLREVFRPRPGMAYISADLDTAEIRALGQTCLDLLGWSKIADFYRANPQGDPHLSFGASMLGMSEATALVRKKEGDPAVLDVRQRAKAANFGFPGGMGARRFVQAQSMQGATFTEAEALQLRALYFAKWPEVSSYFEWVSAQTEALGYGTFTTRRSERTRGGATFCQGANYGFQPIIADVTKLAAFTAARDMYCNKDSALFGSRLVNMVHDELNIEAPVGRVHEAALSLQEHLMRAGKRWCPDVPLTAGAVATDRLTKQCKGPVRKDGRLSIWTPEVSK